MKIVLIGDTHAGARNDSQVFQEYFSRFYEEQFFPYLDSEGISTVIHLGDIIDRRKYINFRTLDDFIKTVIDPINERNIDFHLIIGNHDTFYKSTNSLNSPKSLLWPRPNINQYEEFDTVTFDGVDIDFVPWINEQNEKSTLNKIKKSKSKVLFGHLEVQGFSMYKGFANQEGLNEGLFGNYKLVASGHFHHRSSRGNIHYLGSPYEITWSDYGDAKGFHVFDTDTLELEFIKNNLTMFERICYNDEDKMVIPEIKSKHVKIIVANKKSQPKFDSFLDLVYKKEPYDIEIVEDFSQIGDIDEDDVDFEQDTMTFLNDYVDCLEDYTIKDRIEIKKIMQEIYVEAINE